MSFLARLNRKLLLRYRLEYVLALALLYVVRALSPAVAWGGARRLGRLLWRLGVRRHAIRNNLAIVFPELSPKERDALGLRTMEHFASMVVDVLFQGRMLSRRNFYERFTITGWARDYLDAHGEEGLRRRARGILFLTAHLGNWELATGFFGLLGVKVSPVFRSPQNPFLARLLQSVRLDSQAELIEKRGAVQSMLETFQKGENVGFLFDQEAVYGIDVPFFGQTARTHKTPAVLARDHGARIFFGAVVRRGDFLAYEARGELIDYGEKSDDREADLRRITADLMRRLEAEIRLFPEQYLWMHRRWKRGIPAPEASA